MKFFYWSVDKDPDVDPTLKMSLEATGLLHRLRRLAAIDNTPDGKLTFEGYGDDEASQALLLRLPLARYRKLVGELEQHNEVCRKNGCLLLVKWEYEQKRYFDHLEKVKAANKKKRLQKRSTKR